MEPFSENVRNEFEGAPAVHPRMMLTVIDDDGGSSESVFHYIIIYDPDGGFVTGGGWIASPEGAYALDPTGA